MKVSAIVANLHAGICVCVKVGRIRKLSYILTGILDIFVGLCKFNIKWVLISIVKIWSKTYIYISPKNLSIFEERRLFYKLANFC